MVNIGEFNTLEILQRDAKIITLDGGDCGNIILPVKELKQEVKTGQSLEVFVYVASDGQLAATTQTPLAQVGDVAWLKVVAVEYAGAFLDWGLPKDLLLPFSEQHYELKPGQHCLVKIFLDDRNRVTATTKFLQSIQEQSLYFKQGDQVSIIIVDQTDLGYKAIVNNTHWGVLYRSEVFQKLTKGQKLKAYIKQIRDDRKIDLCLQQPGYGKVEKLADQILKRLKTQGGSLPLSDKSPPEEIYAAFKVSKKVFKQAVGLLYKQHLIEIDKQYINLINKEK